MRNLRYLAAIAGALLMAAWLSVFSTGGQITKSKSNAPVESGFVTVRWWEEVSTQDLVIQYRDDLTLMGILSETKLMDGFRSPRKIKLVRGGRITVIDLRKINPDGSNNPVLQPGDLILVAK